MRILFIGNSHTYVNDLPFIVKRILFANSIECEVTMLSHPGMGLDYHLEQPEMRFNILFGGYDYIVLQHDAHPFRGEGILIEAAKGINEFISKTSATALLYMTWTEKQNREGQAAMAEAYRKAAEEISAKVAPAGIAWELFREKHPECELYAEDGGHASMKGSILTAYTIAATICNGGMIPASKEEEIFSLTAVKAIEMENAAII